MGTVAGAAKARAKKAERERITAELLAAARERGLVPAGSAPGTDVTSAQPGAVQLDGGIDAVDASAAGIDGIDAATVEPYPEQSPASPGQLAADALIESAKLKAAQVMVGIMGSSRSPAAVRITAARAILEHGRKHQQSANSRETLAGIAATLARVAGIRARRAVVVDATPAAVAPPEAKAHPQQPDSLSATAAPPPP